MRGAPYIYDVYSTRIQGLLMVLVENRKESICWFVSGLLGDNESVLQLATIEYYEKF